jgi:probable O-glycosylation ligase (exosortase A-associated)
MYIVLINTINSYRRLKGFLIFMVLTHTAIILVNSDRIIEAGSRVGSFRAGYFLGNGNDFSLSIIMMIPVAVYLLLNETKNFKRLLYIGIIGIFIFIVIICSSRASSLALAAMVILLWIRSGRKTANGIVIGIGILIVIFFASPDYFNRMDTIKNYDEDSSAQMRLVGWKAGWQMALDHPITGVGAGNFSSVYGRFYKTGGLRWYASERWQSPHSTYVQCLAELGFPGLILLLFILVRNFMDTERIRKSNIIDNKTEDYSFLGTALQALLIGYMINAAFLGTLYFPHILIISSIIVSGINVLVEERKMK